MIFWHGTTIENARKIQMEGLRPQPEKKYDIEIPYRGRLKDIEGEGTQEYVYLTEHEELAKFYAEFRTIYEKTAPGTTFLRGNVPVFKLAGETNQNARPAVIRFELPREIAAELEPDNQDWRDAYTFRGEIAPEFVKEVRALCEARERV